MTDGRGGLARVATVRTRLADQGPILFVLAGDLLSPSLLSKYYGGRQMVEALNAAKLDYATFGNHEFELPRDTLVARIAESNFHWISSNCTQADGSPFPKVLPWDTVRVSGHLVGMFGLTLRGDYRSYVRCADPDSVAARGHRDPGRAQGRLDRGAHPSEHRGRPRAARQRADPGPDSRRPRARGARLGGLQPPRHQGRRQRPLGAVRDLVGRQGALAAGGRPGADRQPPARRHAPSRRSCDRWEDSLQRAARARAGGRRPRSTRSTRATDRPAAGVAARRPGHRRDARRHRRRCRAHQRRAPCGWTT